MAATNICSNFGNKWSSPSHCRSYLLLNDLHSVMFGFLMKILLVMPATNASSEHSFSGLRRIKTYLRTAMTQKRLNDLMVLNIPIEKK